MSKQEHSQYRRSKLLKSIRKGNFHPKVGGKRSEVSVSLDTFQIAGLKKLAKKYKTTISSELSNAVDAYLLDLSRDEIRLLGHFADLTKTSLFVGNQKITGILREIDQSTARITRLERRAARARNTKQR